MDCCPKSSWPQLPDDSTYNAKGQIELLNDKTSLQVYTSSVTDASSLTKKKGIILYPDVYGPFTSRSKSIADYFSNHGFEVIAPDCFRGETKANVSLPLGEWLAKFPYEDVVKRDTKDCKDYLKQKGVESIGAIGFCWGVWAVAKESACEGEEDRIKCGVGCHPSILIESFVFGGDDEELAMKASDNVPLLLNIAGNDKENLMPGSKVAENVTTNGGSLVLYEDMVHGWVSRGDYTQEDVKRSGMNALSSALEFFQKKL